MIDSLLGRASLKARIDELETECERLRARYEAESERRTAAVRERQNAEERVNRLEDRIAGLEGELARVEQAGVGAAVRRRERLNGTRTRAVLDRLESVRTDPEGAFTATVDDRTRDRVAAAVGDVLGDRRSLLEDLDGDLLCVDDAGLLSVALDPPIPHQVEPTWSDRFAIDRDRFLPTGRYGFALLRADLFAYGTYDGETQLTALGFESDVKGRHSKGGFSQARFDRIRTEQIDDHLDRAVSALSDHDDSDPLVLVGQREMVDRLAERLPVDPLETGTVDATGDPKPALDAAHRSFWTTALVGL